MPEYTVLKDAVKYKAPDIQTLKRWVREKRIRASDKVYEPSLKKWIYVKEMPELKEDLEKITPKKSSIKPFIWIEVILMFIGLIIVSQGSYLTGIVGAYFLVFGISFLILTIKRTKKTFLVSGGLIGLLFLFNIISSAWVNRNIEIKKVVGTKCSSCGKILSADTTIISIPAREKRGDFITEYRDTLCEKCRKEMVQGAEDLFKEGIKEYRKRNYSAAKVKFQDAKGKYLKANTGKEEIKNITSLLKKITEKERQQKLKALKKLKKDYDDVTGITWYKNPYFIHYNNRNLTSIYIGHSKTSTWLRLKMSYRGDDWIFFEQAYLSYDGNTKEIIFNKYSDKETEVGYGGIVWEWIDISVSSDTERFLRKIVKSKNAKMRLSGKYTKTRNLTWRERQGIIDVLNGYDVLKQGID